MYGPPTPPTPYHNHIMNIYDNQLASTRTEDYEIIFEEEQPSSDDQQSNQRPKKRTYRRHTQEQTQEMEAAFRENPHPDDKQRKEMGARLGLEPLQIKFWFQNRRTQLKVQNEREENSALKAEIEKLRSHIYRYKEAIGNTACNVCGSTATIGEMSREEQQLKLENALFRKELEKFAGGDETSTNPTDTHTILSSSNNSSQAPSRSFNVRVVGGTSNYNGAQNGMVGEAYTCGNGGELVSSSVPVREYVDDKRSIIELAVLGMDELMRLGKTSGPPLWLPTNYYTEILNGDEYMKNFLRVTGPNPFGLRPEGSKESGVIIMNPINLVDILMDVTRWSTMFCGIVARAATNKVLSTGVAGNYNGALQVMIAEFQVPSPFVPIRENYFVRYCKLHQDGIWAVVDVSLDNLLPASSSSSVPRPQRRPSGCLIQELPNGYSKVTWIEHALVNDNAVQNFYTPLINSGLAFGAKRWVATLERQCERLACSMSNNIPIAGDLGVMMSPEGKKSMLKLAERMVTSFSTSIGAASNHAWTNVHSDGSEHVVKVMTKKYVDESGRGSRSPGVVLSTATSFWLPIPPRRTFDFLRDENTRCQWDILSNGGIVTEMAHIANGRDSGSAVSLLRVNSSNTMQSNMVILQESCADITGSYVVYAPVDISSMNVVLNGEDSNTVSLLPSGFAIFPDGILQNREPITNVGSGGSLITVGFQILVDSVPHARLALGSVSTVNHLIKSTVERIKVAVMPNGTLNVT
ncbi:homeobox-leucine zipper protein PROTODERMAL FACTOR 2 [Lathyrus oleraceus]|uniref:Homeobox-leucine zipper protein PROTODERMAL FACTOR 2 n=1 Tax=Pisum sativum TaxID=3888 RepID=A0A9D4XN90_PEA|nr:homeobox-leucine zipper protein PROTODERMAL FACTOR 2-like [Pisum sativum]KAI5423513.1 Homeobox-leucine zipper protein PROTODERMAL FACTOR 2 [Pisum sativum]